MGLSILASGLYVSNGGASVGSPQAGVWYDLNVAWGLGSTDPPVVANPSLSVSAGGSIDTAYSEVATGSVLSTGKTSVIPIGWHPDGKSVYIDNTDAVEGWWRVKLASGANTFTLSGVGTVSINASPAGPAPTLTPPTILILLRDYVGTIPSTLCTLSFNGTYPAGGLDLLGSMVGIVGVLGGFVADTALYRFAWHDNKLQVFNSSGEVSGALNFSTQGWFIGNVG